MKKLLLLSLLVFGNKLFSMKKHPESYYGSLRAFVIESDSCSQRECQDSDDGETLIENFCLYNNVEILKENDNGRFQLWKSIKPHIDFIEEIKFLNYGYKKIKHLYIKGGTCIDHDDTKDIESRVEFICNFDPCDSVSDKEEDNHYFICEYEKPNNDPQAIENSKKLSDVMIKFQQQ